MTIGFKPTPEDRLAFQRHYLATDPACIRSRRRNLFLPPVLYMSFGLLKGLNGPSGSLAIALAVFGGISILWLVFYPKYSVWSHIRRTRRRMEGATDDYQAKNLEVTFDGEGILLKTQDSEERMTWKVPSRVDETPGYFFLYIAFNQALPIPREALTAEETEMLITLFKQHDLLHSDNKN